MSRGVDGPWLSRPEELDRTVRAPVAAGLGVLAAFSAVLLFFPVRDLARGGHDLELVVPAAVALVVAIALHVWVVQKVCRAGPVHPRAQLVAGIETVLFLALTPISTQWVALPMFGLSNVLMTTGGRVRLYWSAAITTAYVLLLTVHHSGAEIAQNLLNFGVATAFFYGITSLVRAALELNVRRAELARLAVGEERLRVARDLHDTLGRSISIALLKLDLAERLAGRDPARAGTETSSARDLLRSSMKELQSVVEGMRPMSLQREIEAASRLLTSAHVAVDVEGGDCDVGWILADTFGWLLREATTNVLRHSEATWCRIRLTQRGGHVQLRVANDGVPSDRVLGAGGGNGIPGMRERLAAVGGSLSAMVNPSGEFVLLASAPASVGRT